MTERNANPEPAEGAARIPRAQPPTTPVELRRRSEPERIAYLESKLAEVIAERESADQYAADLARALKSAGEGLELMYQVRDRQAGYLQEADTRLSEAMQATQRAEAERDAARNRLAAPEEFERARIQALLSSPLLAALRCIPDGTHQSGCVIHDGAKVRERVRQAYLAAFPRPNPTEEQP